MNRKPKPLTGKNLRRLPTSYRLDYDAMLFWRSLSIAERLRLTWKLHLESLKLFSTARKRLQFPVSGSERTVVLKLMAGRKQDLIDVEHILAKADLDKELLLRLAREAMVKQPLMQAAKRAGWSGR